MDHYFVGIAVPILSQDDLMGSVVLIMGETDDSFGDAEQEIGSDRGRLLGQTNGKLMKSAAESAALVLS